MKLIKNAAAIELDFTDLVGVWEYGNQYWELLCISRLPQAIALYKALPKKRLIFPTDVSPPQARKLAPYKAQDLNGANVPTVQPSRIEQTLLLIQKHQGISIAKIAWRLAVKKETVNKYVRALLGEGKIHCQTSRLDNNKLYYPGNAPPEKKALSNRDSAQVKSKMPPVKVYFVKPEVLNY